jgi:O-antigen ligase
MCAIVFAPSRGHLRLEYGIALVAMFVAMSNGRSPRVRVVMAEMSLLALLFASGLLSIFVFEVNNPASSTLWQRDLLSVVRFLIYAGFIAVGALIAPTDEAGLRRVAITVLVLAFGASLLSALQYFGIGGITLNVAMVYHQEGLALGRYENLLASDAIRRVGGTLGNPNWWGWWMSTLTVIAFCWGVSARSFVVLPAMAALVGAIILTGSRTSLASLVVGLAVAAMLPAQRSGRSLRRLGAVIVAFALMASVSSVVLEQVFEARDRFGIHRLDSLYERFRVWEGGLKLFAENPLLGTGPRKSELLRVTNDLQRVSFLDNVYLAMLTRFGLLGASLYFGFLFVALVKARKAVRFAPPVIRWWPVATLSVWIATLVFGLAADTMFFVPTMLLLCLFHGASVGAVAALSAKASCASATAAGKVAASFSRNAPLRSR